ncbi:hypothetical protein [Streptomyces sp. NPDC059171]|uniref:hypothetical protein n=1 Tax=Streptomyces sp. NPDC059171 TaxID=3346755 RepID=UPI0036BD5460
MVLVVQIDVPFVDSSAFEEIDEVGVAAARPVCDSSRSEFTDRYQRRMEEPSFADQGLETRLTVRRFIRVPRTAHVQELSVDRPADRLQVDVVSGARCRWPG